MTAAPELSDIQLDELQELVGPAAWIYHQTTMPEALRLDLDRSYRVRGTVPRVAAVLLLAAAAYARRQAAAGSVGQVKRLKDGAEETEFFASTSDLLVDADTWETLAKTLEAPVSSAQRVTANPAPVLEGWEIG